MQQGQVRMADSNWNSYSVPVRLLYYSLAKTLGKIPNYYHRSWSIDCDHQMICSPKSNSTKTTRWREVIQRAKAISKEQIIELDHVSYGKAHPLHEGTC